jgi:two-component system, OmpR family, osmolarity sensor histidine kinase EnvZ
MIMLAGRNAPRLSAYAAALFLVIGMVQLLASLAFYQSIDRQTLRDDHARRIAEMLVVGERLHALDPRMTETMMNTGHLHVAVQTAPSVAAPRQGDGLDRIAAQIARWEPSLANRPLHLAITPQRGKWRDLIGSIRLADGQWLNFRSTDITSMWPVAWRAMTITLAASLICLALGLMALRQLTTPLRRLSQATEAIGRGQQVTVPETGPGDLRDLAHAMNEMQTRIASLLRDQATSFEAISHDLRTPLSRQMIAADLIDDTEIAALVRASANEMEGMLKSLERFLRAQHLSADAGTMDIAAAARDLVAGYGEKVRLVSPDSAMVDTYREPLLLSLQPLIENAARFGDKVVVTIRQDGGEWLVDVEDDGPGIPDDHFDDVLAPFYRLDEARGRDTGGFGLGIPTAHRLLRRFGGNLSFLSAARGGLIARVHLPRPARLPT